MDSLVIRKNNFVFSKIDKINFPSSKNPTQFVSSFDAPIADQGCAINGNFAMIAHGWSEGLATPWVEITARNLLKYRGGCVFFMDYSKFANVSNYFTLTPHFDGISAVFLKKFRQIGNFRRQYCFGFSFGSRLCIDVGLKIGYHLIDRMDLCDPAGKNDYLGLTFASTTTEFSRPWLRHECRSKTSRQKC